ncbi:hypothetical protein [Asticcacaulis sp.]|uniref:hypothetical protein n=1 Tax=Asticcacaulis sp. TaxID=1872648 RepID=UPI0026149A8F|nr:hypothetical protein [Asticcacaulis sp.]
MPPLIYSIANESDWNNVAAAGPFSVLNVLNITADFTFTAPPAVLPVGSATFNGGSKTITFDFPDACQGIMTLNGGSISNLNINIVQWRGESVLLANSDAFGLVSNISYTGSLSSDTSLLIDTLNCGANTLTLLGIDINLTVTATTNILWNIYLSGILIKTNVTLSINGNAMEHPDNTRIHP